MRQVVGYKRLKTTENQKTFRPKKLTRSLTGGGPFTRCSNCKALTGNVLVFWMSGRLWEVVAF